MGAQVFVAVSAVFVCARLASAEDISFAVSGGVLHVKVPAGWSAETNGKHFPTIELNAPVDQHVKVLMTVFHPAQVPADDALRQMLKTGCKPLADASKEKTTTIDDLKGEHVKGFIASFTDGSPDAGDFPQATSGVLVVGDQVVSLTILTSDRTAKPYAAAVELIKSMGIASVATIAPAGQK